MTNNNDSSLLDKTIGYSPYCNNDFLKFSGVRIVFKTIKNLRNHIKPTDKTNKKMINYKEITLLDLLNATSCDNCYIINECAHLRVSKMLLATGLECDYSITEVEVISPFFNVYVISKKFKNTDKKS